MNFNSTLGSERVKQKISGEKTLIQNQILPRIIIENQCKISKESFDAELVTGDT